VVLNGLVLSNLSQGQFTQSGKIALTKEVIQRLLNLLDGVYLDRKSVV
jgi:hypothetical protein